MYTKEEKQVYRLLTLMSLTAILLMTLPVLMVAFFSISKTMFIVLNTLGLIFITLRVVIVVGISISISAVKGTKTAFKAKLDRETWWLFSGALLVQLISLMFVHFE